MALIKIDAPAKYEVKLTYKDGTISILSHKDADSWSRRTAVKYAREFENKFADRLQLVEILQVQ